MRFTFRALVLIAVFVTFLTNRTMLDFTKNRELFHPINLLWAIFIVSFALQLLPHSRVSRGCLKQFPEHFSKIEQAMDGLRMRTHLTRLDLGATRVALLWIGLNLIFWVLYLRGIIGVPSMVLLASVTRGTPMEKYLDQQIKHINEVRGAQPGSKNYITKDMYFEGFEPNKQPGLQKQQEEPKAGGPQVG